MAEQDIDDDWDPLQHCDGVDAGEELFGKQRRRGSAKQRMRVAFNQNEEQVYKFFLVQEDWSELRAADILIRKERVAAIMEEYFRRPDGTVNTYWPLIEQFLDVLGQQAKNGKLPGIWRPGVATLKPTFFGECSGATMLPILKSLCAGQKISKLLQVLQEQAAADKQAAADAAAMAEFNDDDYNAGDKVYIIGDAGSGDTPEDEDAELLILACGIVTADSDVVVNGARTVKVGNLVAIDSAAAASQSVWVDDDDVGHKVGETTLSQLCHTPGSSSSSSSSNSGLLVPLTLLRRVDQPQEGHQHAGGQHPAPIDSEEVEVSLEQVDKMKLRELRDLSKKLGLGVKSNRKAAYKDELTRWVGKETLADGSAGRRAAITTTSSSSNEAVQQMHVSRFSLKNMLNAAQDLQSIQLQLLGDNRPSTIIRRHPPMARFLQMFRRVSAVGNRRAVRDRHAGTIATLPTSEQMKQVLKGFFDQRSGQALKLRASWLDQSSGTTRGQDAREMEFADRIAYEYAELQPVPGEAVLTIKENGKTNQNGQLQYHGALRHRDPAQCPLAADGMYQLYRFYQDGEGFPDFTMPLAEWMFTPVFPSGASSMEKMEYEEQRYGYRTQLDQAGITGTKSTHLPRQSARLIIDRGGTREQAMAHALWLRQDADLSYLNMPDINAMLYMADFRGLPKHFQTWGQLPPPASCLEKLFVTPDGKTITQQIAELERLNKDTATRNHTALGVAKYFKLIGTAALQALPLLLAKGYAKDHPLLQHPAINNQDFRVFAQQQVRHVRQVEGGYLLSQTPVQGPVFSMAAGDGGVVSSAECTEQERCSMLVNGASTFAAAAATATSVSVASGLQDGMHFMLVSTAEMQQLLQQRAAAQLTAGAAAAAAARNTEAAAGAHAPTSSEAAAPDAAAGAACPREDAGSSGGAAQGGAAETIVADIAAAVAAATTAEPHDGAIAEIRQHMSLLLGMLMLQTKALQSGLQAPPARRAAGLAAAGFSSIAGNGATAVGATVVVGGADADYLECEELLVVADEQQGNAITVRALGTVTKLVQCWQKGWPLSVPAEHRVYKPMTEGGFDTKGLDKKDKNQLDLMKQGYLLVCAVSEQHNISKTAAAAVVELWRQGKLAAVQHSGNGPAVTAAAAEQQQQQQQDCAAEQQQGAAAGAGQPTSTIVLHSWLPGDGSAMSLDKLCKEARSLKAVQERKDSKKREAGKKGGDTKRQRRAAGGAVGSSD